MGPTHEAIVAAISQLEAKVDGLALQVAETKEIVETWRAVRSGGKVITWLAKIAAAVIGLVVFVKAGAVALVDWGSKP